MKKESNTSFHSSMVSLFACLFIICLRWVMKDNYTAAHMAVITLLSINYVLFALFQKGTENINNCLELSNLPHKVIEKKKRKHTTLLSILVGFLALTELVYFFLFTSALANDILSIIALFVSVEDNFFCTLFFKMFSKNVNI